MNCVCIVPAIFKMLFSKNNAGSVGKALIIFIDLLALIAQATSFVIVMGTQYTAFIEKAAQAPTTFPPVMDDKMGDGSDPFANAEKLSADELPQWKIAWELPFALLFTSIGWWENFVDRDIKIGCLRMKFASYKRHLQSVRAKANIGASLLKIVLTIAFSILMLPSAQFENAFVHMPASVEPKQTVQLSADALTEFNNNPESFFGSDMLHKVSLIS